MGQSRDINLGQQDCFQCLMFHLSTCFESRYWWMCFRGVDFLQAATRISRVQAIINKPLPKDMLGARQQVFAEIPST